MGHSGKKYSCIEESPVQFQTYMRNQEQQHLYLHGDLRPQEELAPTESRKELKLDMEENIKGAKALYRIK